EDRRLADQIDFEVLATGHDLVVKPPKWSHPFTDVSANIHATPELIVVENAEGQYFQDKYFVTAARIPLKDIDREVRIEEIAGSAQLSGTVEDYPRPFDFIARQIRPGGMFYAIGSYRRPRVLPPGQKPQFRFDIRSDQARA